MMGNRRAIAYLFLIFLLGVALGVVGTLWAEKTGWAYSGWSHGHSPREGAQEWLTRELNLAAEQQKQLGAILDETAQGYRTIRERIRPEFDAVRQQGREKIRAMLTPEQRAHFEELVRELDEKRAQQRREYENRRRP